MGLVHLGYVQIHQYHRVSFETASPDRYFVFNISFFQQSTSRPQKTAFLLAARGFGWVGVAWQKSVHCSTVCFLFAGCYKSSQKRLITPLELRLLGRVLQHFARNQQGSRHPSCSMIFSKYPKHVYIARLSGFRMLIGIEICHLLRGIEIISDVDGHVWP